jgi:hypothetical protein
VVRRDLALIVLAIVVSMPGPAAGARRLACLRACGPAISLCVSDGGRPRPCRRQVVRGCRRDGVAACAVPDPRPPVTTTTTLVDGPAPPPTTLPEVEPPPGETTTTQPPVVVTTTTTPTTPTTSTTLLPPPPPPPCGGEILLIAEDDQYLGCVSCSEFHPDSIVNQFGDYGSEFSPSSIWNELGVYGSSTGPYSACNPFTRTPPRMEDENGCGYGHLGLNEFVVDSVCGIHGDDELCATLHAICAD